MMFTFSCGQLTAWTLGLQRTENTAQTNIDIIDIELLVEDELVQTASCRQHTQEQQQPTQHCNITTNMNNTDVWPHEPNHTQQPNSPTPSATSVPDKNSGTISRFGDKTLWLECHHRNISSYFWFTTHSNTPSRSWWEVGMPKFLEIPFWSLWRNKHESCISCIVARPYTCTGHVYSLAQESKPGIIPYPVTSCGASMATKHACPIGMCRQAFLAFNNLIPSRSCETSQTKGWAAKSKRHPEYSRRGASAVGATFCPSSLNSQQGQQKSTKARAAVSDWERTLIPWTILGNSLLIFMKKQTRVLYQLHCR